MQPGEFVDVALSYHSQLWNAALRMARDRTEAEDFLQETYRRAFEHGGELRQLSHCRAWLFRILTALVIDTRRREQRSPVLTVVDGGVDSARDLEPQGNLEAEMIDHLTAQEITRLVAALPPAQRVALTLCDIEGFSYEEIAAILDCPIGTVRSRIARARAFLMVRLEAHALAHGIGARQ